METASYFYRCMRGTSYYSLVKKLVLVYLLLFIGKVFTCKNTNECENPALNSQLQIKIITRCNQVEFCSLIETHHMMHDVRMGRWSDLGFFLRFRLPMTPTRTLPMTPKSQSQKATRASKKHRTEDQSTSSNTTTKL